jgi:hypothetical protein
MRSSHGGVILIAYLRAKRESSLPLWVIIFLVYDDPTDCVINREGQPDKNGSVQESDTARDLSGVGFPVRTCTVAAVAVGMWKLAFGAGSKLRGTSDNSA